MGKLSVKLIIHLTIPITLSPLYSIEPISRFNLNIEYHIMLYLAQVRKNEFLDQYQLRLLARQEAE